MPDININATFGEMYIKRLAKILTEKLKSESKVTFLELDASYLPAFNAATGSIVKGANRILLSSSDIGKQPISCNGWLTAKQAMKLGVDFKLKATSADLAYFRRLTSNQYQTKGWLSSIHRYTVYNVDSFHGLSSESILTPAVNCVLDSSSEEPKRRLQILEDLANERYVELEASSFASPQKVNAERSYRNLSVYLGIAFMAASEGVKYYIPESESLRSDLIKLCVQRPRTVLRATMTAQKIANSL